MASSSLAANAAVSLGSRPARALRARRVAQPAARSAAARRSSIVRAAAADGGSYSPDEASNNHRRRRRRADESAKNSHGAAPTPRTPGDLHRRAAAAAARALDDALNGLSPQGEDASSSAAASAASRHVDSLEFQYPYPIGDAANAVSPMARGVCWSNLQDLDTVPDDNSVYILVFGAGTGSEGLYSLQERTKEDVPVDIILAFPSHEDAARYGTLLEAEMGRIPVVEAARPKDLRFTCTEGGYRCKVARRGVLLMPPEKTVEVTDWERTNALRQGQWSVQLDDSDASASRTEGCQVMAAGIGADGQVIFGASDACAPFEDNYDELVGALPVDYDELSAREMLSRMFNRGDWSLTTNEEEE